jgi:hypothetical protein
MLSRLAERYQGRYFSAFTCTEFVMIQSFTAGYSTKAVQPLFKSLVLLL